VARSWPLQRRLCGQLWEGGALAGPYAAPLDCLLMMHLYTTAAAAQPAALSRA